ncbi:acetaldehyde dehydrogenase (acetylating) [Corynebacterium sp. CCM 8835]|uniref:Acetaldehyde dehydrogenase n=1 Tax=Corynebacterium antarcticum TaxID=2800405 RepID=A0ABS1FNJ4_9CORY|nr:acetaldehyde dehydrogenase (acetylating) [Corynebacterium antarcticum]MCK7641981.1 acetaldehyde dehydrogenase (acetylating) [Corynebacterium antarcticum]MCL0245205.1 acetaldehyde dehydrogenase (acetylating) [Corynebacterium antarcticum]
MSDKYTAAIVGPGNIGTDLLMKLLKNSRNIEPVYMIGVDPTSDGLARAEKLGVEASPGGVDWLLSRDRLPDIVFEATSAGAHRANAHRYREAGIRAIDLTPAAVGPHLCPSVNMDTLRTVDNVNMITCGGQATTPIVAAVSRVVPVEYAEIVASISSRSAGPGTRASIDEFMATTSAALEKVGGAKRAKSILILNPVEPPMLMRNTVYCALPPEAAEPGPLRDRIRESVQQMVADVQKYVPGYHLTAEPQFDTARADWRGWGRVTVLIEVRGAADYLPEYAGNLDIITAAAVATADTYVDLLRRDDAATAPVSAAR